VILKVLIIALIYCLFFVSFLSASPDRFLHFRKQMVIEQIKNRGIKDKNVLDAMLKVERHLFVPTYIRAHAYQDSALPIGEGQTISQPYIVAVMTEALELKGSDRVLEIGTGSGYQAAILAEIAKEVYTIEIIPTLAKRAKKLLDKLGYKNIHVKLGDGYLGWPDNAPFDAIIVTCATDKIPNALIEQLADGGRMVIPLGGYGYQELTLIKKKDNRIEKSFITGCIFVPMTGQHISK
jgi:protein-L-isoaspartate(D-aspartate) O-methyltransferase